MPVNWPTLHESHSAVEAIDELFDRLDVDRAGDVTTRNTDRKHTYHHFRCVTEFDGRISTGQRTFDLDDATVEIEAIHSDGRVRMLVDTGSI